MADFIGKDWEPVLKQNRLDQFERLWAHEAGWFEAPNERRGGWSGVSRIALTTADGRRVGGFLKRQENHLCKTVRHPLRGEPTFAREFRNILRFKENGVPSLEPIYYAQRVVSGKLRAILLTEELEGFLPLSVAQWQPGSERLSSKIEKQGLFIAVASLMRAMHAANFQQNCCYPKHLFVKKTEQKGYEARVIDLEKVKWQPIQRNAILRDLYTLYRHSASWPITDQMRFFKMYRNEKRLSEASKKIWRSIARKLAAKTG